MLWWDDNVPAIEDVSPKGISDTVEIGEGEVLVSCYRSAGAVPVPRKISKSSKGPPEVPLRKLSVPTPEVAKPLPRRKLTLPVAPPPVIKPQQKPQVRVNKLPPEPKFNKPIPQPKPEPKPIKKEPPPKPKQPELKLKNPIAETLVDELTESTSEFLFTLSSQKAKCSIVGKSEATEKAVVLKPKVITEKPKIESAVIKQELKRGSMKDKWGLKLVYQMSQQGGLCLGVLKVTSFTAGHKAKLQAGDHVLTINGWQIQSMEEPQVAANLFRAAGFSVVLGLERSNLHLNDWNLLDDF